MSEKLNMNLDKELTVIIPAYNESESIESTLQTLIDFSIDMRWRIIVVNDGSSDNTAEKVSEFPSVCLINHPYNKGYGASLKTGIKDANTEIIAFYDADGQHTPEDLKKMYDNFDTYDMFVGQRGKDSHQEWIRKPGKWLLSKVANFLTGRKIPDLNSGLRIIKKNVINKMLHLFPEGFSFSTTSTIAFLNMGYSVGYHPIVVNRRVGKSTVKQLKDGSNVMLLILRLIVLFNPLKVFIPSSFILFAIGLIYEIYAGIIIHPNPPKLIPGAFFVMLTGVLLFFFGLVVDQISEMRKYMNNHK